MSSASLRSCSRFGKTRIDFRPRGGGSFIGGALRQLGVALAAAMLAACAQSSATTGKFTSSSSSRQGVLESPVKTSFSAQREAPGSGKEQASLAVREHAKATSGGSFGLASTYGEGSQTASGERFNANGLTAAHRTLPFGTRVRVTNHRNGRSVIVTINDRGPFVSGRIIDVTPAAARMLGMSGVAPVSIERE